MTLRRPTTIQELAPYATLSIISFLAFPSQWLFTKIEPGPLNGTQFIKFNIVIFSIMYCYCRAWLSDPGRVPGAWTPAEVELDAEAAEPAPPLTGRSHQRLRWCRRCEAYKPPRAHHCKTCKRWAPLAELATIEPAYQCLSDVSLRWTTTVLGLVGRTA